jgi:hypothetical protein
MTTYQVVVDVDRAQTSFYDTLGRAVLVVSVLKK